PWPSPKAAWEAVFCGGIATRMAPYLDRPQDIDPGLPPIIQHANKWPAPPHGQPGFHRLTGYDPVRRYFDTHDLLLTPTIATPPFKVGLDNPADIAGPPVEAYDWIPFTYPVHPTADSA